MLFLKKRNIAYTLNLVKMQPYIDFSCREILKSMHMVSEEIGHG